MADGAAGVEGGWALAMIIEPIRATSSLVAHPVGRFEKRLPHRSSQAGLMQIAFASQELRSRRVRGEGAAVGSSANVLRPLASSFISLRHPLRRPRQPASVFCVGRTPTLLEESGWWGAQRSGIKEEAEGRGTAAKLSAPPA